MTSRAKAFLLVVAGCAAVAAGTGMVYLPAGVIVGGVLTVALGLLALDVR